MMDSLSNEVPKHTPGKWFADHWGDDNSQPIAIQSVRLDGVTFIGEIESNKMADARLIAAAAEMLQTLKLFYDWSKNGTKYPQYWLQTTFVDKCSEIIAKAEGRQL
jgi:hypothetical protein